MTNSNPDNGSGFPRLEGVLTGVPGSLAAAYTEGRPAIQGLFPEPDSWKARSRDQPPRLPTDALGAPSPNALAKLETILDGDGFLVSTGQQPVLFGGPLYVLYKALTAIEAARRLETESGTQCMALFWIGSDDHDWAEVARTRLIDTAGTLQDFRLPPSPGREGTSVGPSILPADIEPELARFIACLPESEFRSEVQRVLGEAYRPGRTYSAAFADALNGLLPEEGWAWIDSAKPAVRRASAPLLRWALEARKKAEAAFRDGTNAVESLGFASQMTYLPHATQLFWEVDGQRTRLYSGQGETTLRLGRAGDSVPDSDVLGALETEPERFSPTASMRPVLESWLLPVGATVLGPSEIAYWAQLRPLFGAAQVQMPAVMSRFGWTVVEKRIARILDRLETPAESLAHPERLARELVHDSVPATTGQSLQKLRGDVEAGFQHLGSAIEADLPGLKASSGKAHKAVAGALHELERAIESRTREQQAILIDQVAKAALHLYPEGVPQERVLSPFFFLARYGPGFVGDLMERGESREIPLSLNVAGPIGPG